jgi:hypothetical protein
MKSLCTVFIFVLLIFTLISAQDDDQWLLLADFETGMNGWDKIYGDGAVDSIVQSADPSGDSNFSLRCHMDGSLAVKGGFCKEPMRAAYGDDMADGLAIYVWLPEGFISEANGVQIFAQDTVSWSWQNTWYNAGDMTDGSWNRLYFDFAQRLIDIDGYDTLMTNHAFRAGVEFVLNDGSVWNGHVYADNIYLPGVPPDAQTDIPFQKSAIPGTFELAQNYPNPFNPLTRIEYFLPQRDMVTITIYDLTGRLVTTVVDQEIQPAGRISVTFNASNLSSGTYFYKVQTSSAVQVKKMLLIR